MLQPLSQSSSSLHIPILYQDDYCVAVNKPAGMLVHPSWLAKHETQFVMKLLRDQLGRYVYPVHRLDRPTSGVLLFALDSDSARLLSQAFEQHHVNKVYWAVVRGWMGIANGELTDGGRIDYPLSVIRDKIADKHSRDDKADQVAVTDWQVLATTEQAFQARSRYATSRYSWLQLMPFHGRKHQLRRHLKHVFHPIVGDTSYGDHHQNRAIRQHVGVSRLMLHAYQLSFPDLSLYSSHTYHSNDDVNHHAKSNAKSHTQYNTKYDNKHHADRHDTLHTKVNGRVTVTAPLDDDWLRLLHQFDW